MGVELRFRVAKNAWTDSNVELMMVEVVLIASVVNGATFK